MDCAQSEPHTPSPYNNSSVELCMEQNKMKGFPLPNDGSVIMPIDERVRVMVDRKQRACMTGHRCIEFGKASERRIHRLSDQENKH